MPTTLEERVAYLEGKVEEHSSAWQDLRERITHMEQTFNQRFVSLEQSLNQRVNETNQRIDKLYLLIIATLASSIGSLIAAVVSIVVR